MVKKHTNALFEPEDTHTHTPIQAKSVQVLFQNLFVRDFSREMAENLRKCRILTTGSTENRSFRNFAFHMGRSVVMLSLIAYLTPLSSSATVPVERVLTPKRMAADDSPEEGFPDYETRLQYDGYPIIVPKRAALILDRILKEIESAREGNQLINDWSPISRRGNNKDKLYFRCYFNAVSCYKRK